jgi:anti-sigma factor RsiW
MAYLDGELPADYATEALSHLEQCQECQVLAADFRGVSQALMAWEVESPEGGISSEINAAIGERFQERVAAKVSLPRLRAE